MAAAAFPARHRGWLAQLQAACAAGDEGRFALVLEKLVAIRTVETLADVQGLSDSLLAALARFRFDSRLAALAASEVPDAQLRLDHVLKMTEEATHRTLDIVERTAPLADAIARDASGLAATLDSRTREEICMVLTQASGNAEQVRRNLSEVVLNQGFQDLTGQILHGVRTLVAEVESILQELASVTGARLEAGDPAAAPDTSPQGPAVPNVTRNALSRQSDVDDLMAELGI